MRILFSMLFFAASFGTQAYGAHSLYEARVYLVEISMEESLVPKGASVFLKDDLGNKIPLVCGCGIWSGARVYGGCYGTSANEKEPQVYPTSLTLVIQEGDTIVARKAVDVPAKSSNDLYNGQKLHLVLGVALKKDLEPNPDKKAVKDDGKNNPKENGVDDGKP